MNLIKRFYLIIIFVVLVVILVGFWCVYYSYKSWTSVVIAQQLKKKKS